MMNLLFFSLEQIVEAVSTIGLSATLILLLVGGLILGIWKSVPILYDRIINKQVETDEKQNLTIKELEEKVIAIQMETQSILKDIASNKDISDEKHTSLITRLIALELAVTKLTDYILTASLNK